MRLDIKHDAPLDRARTAKRPPNRADKVGVLFVHSATQPPLGADTWVQSQIIAGLEKSRFEVHVACAFGAADAPTPTFGVIRLIPEIRLVPIDFGRERLSFPRFGRTRTLCAAVPAVLSVVRLASYIRRHDIAVIHTTDRPRDAAACVLLARLTRARCVIHAHVGFDSTWMSGMLQRAIKRADGLIAISEFVGSTLRSAGIDPDRVHVVLNAIDTSGWKPRHGREERRAEFGFSSADTVVLTVCRLFPSKGPDQLIRALALVHEERPDVRLLVVGREVEAGYTEKLKLLASELGVGRNVVFTGQRSDVPGLMAAADIYAMASEFEPFGLVYLEAMAMELPVIAVNSGGTPEVVEHESNGLLSNPGDAQSLADNLLTCINEPQRRSEMGRRGRHRAETTFTIERMARGCEAIYRLLTFGETGTGER
jgi:glycosyltransferase involved in cell wall biosynthesis